ncbi:response regulator transcription factor [Actinoplanes sp. DH11]|uniref:response regulator transcription factor n=1 Tax=Actinoplanes sp. DH11 TaxID=2857011 RepID=UPI001E451792|nr:response regulator [Actinoplanes sp. DH11]
MPQSSTTITFSDAEAGGLWRVEDWAAALEPPTVLVVEDDEEIRERIAEELRAAGYRALVTDNGRTAMALAAGERPNLIVLDVTTRKLNGLGFCYELHSSPETARIPVIICGDGEPSDMELGRVVGAEDYLVKPFAPADLLARVSALIPV